MNQDKITQKTITDQVTERLRLAISRGDFKPGDRIPTESELAEMLGTGRSSIREALKIFHYLGVLKSSAGRGTYVCHQGNISIEAMTWTILLGERDFLELLDLRDVIEQRCVKHLTRMVSEKRPEARVTLEEMARQVRTLRESIVDSRFDRVVEADYDFHNTIVQAYGNSVYTAVFRVLRSFLLEEIRKTYSQEADPYIIVRQHQQLLEVIWSGDIEKAVRSHENHIEEIRATLMRLS